jgi:hypothetical protein
MAQFSFRVGRKTVFWTDHALDRWWERCGANHLTGRQAALKLLRERLEERRLERELPPWADVTLWHRARAEGFLYIDETSGFIINKNPSRDLVAVTYIEADED